MKLCGVKNEGGGLPGACKNVCKKWYTFLQAPEIKDTAGSPASCNLGGRSPTSGKESLHANYSHSMDLARQIMIDSAHNEAHQVIARLVKENTNSPTEALSLLKEVINMATGYDEQMAEIVAAAWIYIETHELWGGIYDSIYELQQVMNFQQMIEPMLQKAKRYDTQRMNLMKTITCRWRTSVVEAIPTELRPKTMGRSLLTALCSLADRMPDHKEAVGLIRRQVAHRVGTKTRRTQVVKASDIQAIMDDFYRTDRMAVEGVMADLPEDGSEQSKNSEPENSEQSDNSEQFENSEQSENSENFEQSDQPGQPNQTRQPEQSDNSDQSDQSDQPNQTEQSEQSNKSGQSGQYDHCEISGGDEDEVEEDKRPIRQQVGSSIPQRQQRVPVKVPCKQRATPGCRQCHAECWQFLGRIPAKVRMPHGPGMRLLELTRRVNWMKFCYKHIRALAGNCAGLKNSSGTDKVMLIGRMNMVLHYRDQPYKLQAKFPEWFPVKVVPKGEVRKHLGPYMWQPEKPKTYTNFQFDAKKIFNCFARSDNAWEEFQRDGTINIDGFFDYLVNDPQIFCLVEEEFSLYKYHRRDSAEDGDEPRGWMRHMFYSLTQQLVRQDPAYWAMVAAARPDQNWRLVSYPYYTKDTTPGEATGFRHLDINVDRYVKTRDGENIIQGSLSLDDEDDHGCTILVKGFHHVIHLWWERVAARGKARSGNTTNAPSDLYTEEDRRTFGELEPVPCKRGTIRITKPEILHGSTPLAQKQRRTVFVWHYGVHEDHEMLDLEKAETWSDLVRCHQGFIAPHKSTSGEGFRYGRPGFTFPGVTRLGSTSCIGDAIVGARRWDDSAVLKERDILLGSDGAMAWELINEIRVRLKLEFVKAFQYVRENEIAAYGDRSFYRKARGEVRPAADGDASDSDVSELSMLDEDAVRAKMVAVRRGKNKGESEAERMPDTDEESVQAVANNDNGEEDEDEGEDEDEDEVDE